MQYRETRYGTLRCIEAVQSTDAKWVVLFHGYGADASDLAPLAGVLAQGSNTSKVNWLFPEGPLTVPIGPHMHGKAWFPIDIDALENPALRAQRQLAENVPPGMSEATSLAKEMLADLDVPSDRLILGGFSQGAMLATEISLTYKNPSPCGLTILSGTLLCRDRWAKLSSNLSGLNFFQSHGTGDPLLPVDAARELNKVLNQGGLEGELLEFPGGHEIPQIVLKKLQIYLESASL